MIKVTLKNIEAFELPLENFSKVLKRGTSKEVLERLEKKYGKKSCDICYKDPDFGYTIYANAVFNYIPEEDKNKWVTNYEVYVRSSFTYKFWIMLYRFITAFEV